MPPDAPDAPELPGYEYVSVLGSGGFSEVYLYRQKLPRRQVAVKVLRLEAEDTATRREFVAEANAMARLSSHPSIATIFAADISPAGHPYLVMEYCPGGSLATKLKTAAMPVADVLNVGVRMAAALESAHRAGIIHRDVKPSNILLNELKAPVLTDFGISVGGAVSDTTIMRDSTSTTRSGGLSVPWAPPEAFLDEPPSDPRSDVYSLAATLFTLLEGRTPFELPTGNNGAISLSRRIERGEITAPSASGVPESVRDVLRDAMAVDAAQRPSSAILFAEQLQNLQRELSLAQTPIEILGAEGDTPEDLGEAVGETTLIRPVVPSAATMVRAPKPVTEVDIETQPRGPRKTATNAGRRAVAIAGTLLLCGAAVAAVNAFRGPSITPCPTEFAIAVSKAHSGKDVTSIPRVYAPQIATSGADVLCGAQVGDLQLLVLNGTQTSRLEITTRFESSSGWTCDRNVSRYRCSARDGDDYLYIFPKLSIAYGNTIVDPPSAMFYVEIHHIPGLLGAPAQ